MFRTSNPAFNNSHSPFGAAQTWEDLDRSGRGAVPGVDFGKSPDEARPARKAAASGAMTLNGVVSKSLFLVALCVASAVGVWNYLLPFDKETGTFGVEIAANPAPFVFGGLIAGLVFAMITIFKPKASPVTAPLYAIAEGVAMGGVSALYAVNFAKEGDTGPMANAGLVFNALLLTFGTLAGMLLLYATRIIKPTEKFKAGVVAATFGVMLVYLASFVMSIFGVAIPFLHDSGPIGIGISLVIIAIAALNLVLDFDFVEKGVRAGLPKHNEWYAGFGLLVTLVWLYLEFLRLLAKLQSRE